MKRSSCLAILSLLVLVTTDPASALTDVETSCRESIAKAVTRHAGLAAKAVTRCHQKRSKGGVDLAVDCNVVAQADWKGRMASRRARSIAKMAAACRGAEDLLDHYVACPAPASGLDDGGPTTGIDDFTELADCLFAIGNVHIRDLAREAQGTPDERLLDPLRRCQKTIGKGSARIVRAQAREVLRCQARVDRDGGDGSYVCADADPRGRVRKAEERLADKAERFCAFSPGLLDKLQACASDAAGLADCAATSAFVQGASLIREAYTLSGTASTTTTTLPGTACGDTAPQCDGSCPAGTVCEDVDGSCTCTGLGSGPCAPATIRRSIYSKFSTDRESVTSLNAGWSGLGFDIDVPHGSRDTIDVHCDENCENCAVSLKAEADDPRSNCRCTSDPTKSCTAINGSDPTTCGSIDPTCRCYFGAPLQITAGGNPACVALRIRKDYGGTMNLRTGEWSDEMNIAAIVYLGVDAQRPCPTCEGDPVPNDGIRGGTCTGGVGSAACDTNGVHPTYGPASNDCLPPAASNISGTGLLIDLDLSTDEVTLPATLPCDTPSGSLCHCRTCTGNSLLACSDDAQCAAIGAGTCTASGGAGVRLNECENFQCSADRTCTTGPVDMYCDGKLYPDGTGYVPCTNNNDCSQSNSGTCTLPALRRCFPDPITFVGEPDVYEPTKVSAFCVAPTSNPAINIATGLPGPGALLLTLDHDIRCQSDPGIPYEFPSGANCGGFGSTTTTTLLPLEDCGDSDAPTCGGLCPAGQACTDNSGTCTCVGEPLPSCENSDAPVCGGVCSGPGQVCIDNEGTCECQVVTLPQCSGASAPTCGGVCPDGELCTNVGNSCECGAPGVPACGTAIAPACGGVCDIGQACVADGGACNCLTLPLPTCAASASPTCLGTCALGSRCGDVGGACQCTTLPMQ